MTPEVKERIEQIRRGEVPEGYKKTNIGIIPSTWTQVHIRDICDVNPHKSRDIFGKVTFLGMTDVSEDGEILHQNIMNIESVKNGLTPFQRGDILVAKITPCFENGKGALTTSLSTKYGFGSTEFHVLRSKVDNRFLFYHTASHRFRRGLESEMTGSAGQKRVQTDSLASFSLGLPSDAEQQKIAEILTTQDRLIELKEKLIAEKQRQKIYLMQQLLTGKKRLPGFSGEWHTRKFSDIFSFLPTNTLSRADMCDDTGVVMNVHYGDVLIKYAEVLRVNQNKIPYIVEGKEPAKCVYLQNGDIVIADTAEDMTVGKATEVQGITCEKIVSGLHTMCVRPKNGVFAPEWLGFYINSTEFHGQLMRLACGSKVSSISKNTIKDTILNVPTITEQTVIANILSTADREIELLQQELEQEKQKKKSLMQLLLTGIVRV